jgi:hypothetical protein
MSADPIAKLRRTGRTLPPKTRADVLAMAPEITPRLVALLADADGGWASVHAADLLVDLKAAEAIGPMLGALGELDFDDSLFNRIVMRLPELGGAVLEPALAFLGKNEDDEETVQAVCEVLAKLGIKDERIFEALSNVFKRGEEPLAAGLLADYGDPRALPLVERAVFDFQPDFTRVRSRGDLAELLEAHERLGGDLPPHVRERIDGWFAEWDARHRRSKAASPPVRKPKVGRNDPCPCGSGKKYKKCCLDADEAARPRVAEANGDPPHVGNGVSDDPFKMARQFFREKDASRGPAQQMADYAKPILDATDGSLDSTKAALNMAMLLWNLAITRDEAKREETLADMMLRLDEADRAEFDRTARMMIDRHREMFPEMHPR